MSPNSSCCGCPPTALTALTAPTALAGKTKALGKGIRGKTTFTLSWFHIKAKSLFPPKLNKLQIRVLNPSWVCLVAYGRDEAFIDNFLFQRVTFQG